MEDSVGEEERREQGETVAQAKACQEDQEQEAAAVGAGGEPGGEEGGFLSAVASKIGAAMSGANGVVGEDGGEVNTTAAYSAAEEEKGDGNGGAGGIFHKLLSSSPPASEPASGAMETEEVNGEEKNQDAGREQAGILSSMASRIGMTMSGANGNGNHSTEEDAKMSNGDAVDGSNGEEKEKGDEANGGRILNAMASKIGMAMSGGNGVHGEDVAKTSNGDAAEVEKGKGDEAKSGGLVDHIISNLPSDDQAPDADEAILLIAIIED